MSKKPVLVVMAAGMGSRYGGLKQIDPVGSHGEAILDYSLFDAHKAGFETAVIIIKDAIKKDFMETVGARLSRCPMEIRYAYQEIGTAFPQGVAIPEGRVKPWGTSHAVLSAKEQIDDAPFMVINADDYYGQEAFKTMYTYLSQAKDGSQYDYCMVGYRLGNTVTENGSVSRGVCTAGADGHLISVVERTRIECREEGIAYTEDGETWLPLAFETPVSMNMWGFTPSFLRELSERFPLFLEQALASNPLKAEFYLPAAVSQLLAEGKATIKVLHSADKWYGVTYAADKPMIVAALQAMAAQGKYPDGLWK